MYYSRRNNVCDKERYGQALTESVDFFTFSEYVLWGVATALFSN